MINLDEYLAALAEEIKIKKDEFEATILLFHYDKAGMLDNEIKGLKKAALLAEQQDNGKG